MKVGLIACGKLKNTVPCKAHEMYTSILFKKAYAYCISNYDRVYILSAKYGIIGKDCLIVPYDESMNNKTKTERNEWCKSIMGILMHLHNYDDIYVHAGKNYADCAKGMKCHYPLKGLGIGQQLKWYTDRGY